MIGGVVHSALLLVLAVQCPDGQPACPRPRPPTALAVMYFENASRDSADRSLVEAISEEVMDRLDGVGRFAVRSRHSVNAWREQPPSDYRQLGRTLRVDYIITGTFRRFGNRIRVSAELVDPAANTQIWSERFDRSDGAALELVSEVASEIATRLLGRLEPAERSTVRRRPTTNRAFEHFAAGNFLLRNRSGIDEAIAEYRAAVRLDPRYAAALGRFALAHALWLHWGPNRNPAQRDSVLRAGMEAAERAIQLEPSSSDAWMARGYLRATAGPDQLALGRADLERAIQLDSDNAEAWHQLASTLAALGQDSAAFAAFDRALAIEPSRFITLYERAVLLLTLGRLPAARTLFDSARAIERNWHFGQRIEYLRTLVLLGDTAEAHAALRDWRGGDTLTRDCPITCVIEAHLVARQGDTARARTLLARSSTFRQRLRRDSIPAEGCTLWVSSYLLANEKARALNALRQVRPAAQRAMQLRHPACASLRADPEYDRLLAEATR